ncbi:MAG: hypothetical protein DI624_08795 [Brevundimonas sp.]|nr:MAG: hypothetical protein DI624_08795 [Brevundimonas sp.]
MRIRVVYYAWLAESWENIYAICNVCAPEEPDLFPVIGDRCAIPDLQTLTAYATSGLWPNGPPIDKSVFLNPYVDKNFHFHFQVRRNGVNDKTRRYSPARAITTLFRTDATLSKPERWLLKLRPAEFDAVVRTLRSILAIDQEFEVVRRDEARERCVVVTATSGPTRAVMIETPFSQVSSGFRSVLAMVCDVLEGLMHPKVNPNSKLRGMEDGEVMVLHRIAGEETDKTTLPVFVEMLTDLPGVNRPLARRAALPGAAMRKLADADAFRSLGLDRREALWAVRRLPDDDPLPLFAAAEALQHGARELGAEPDARLPPMPLGEHVAADYQTTRLSLKAHPMQLLRPVFAAENVLSCAEAEARGGGSLVRVAGVVLVRQRPGKGNAIFVTLEDETGVVNVVLWARLFEQFRREVMAARLMQVEGVVEKSPENVVHLVVRHVIDRSDELSRLSEEHETQVQLARADVVANPQLPRLPPHRHPRDARILPGSRDFH